ncbi:HNH endonuclease family protein [Mesobacillus jeotgali]|uniref:HNH endonuclease family protein n=1 Tax=Mesobacillus jeotgali TaxID=129985 RepID=UPI000C8451D4|nr:HNH endonuclease family protein [Mesobacillus jeotgali]
MEHFQPQHPVEGECWEQDDWNGFGNLALLTVSGNSRFSNLPPAGKINSYPSIIKQSLKLKVMEKMTRLGEGKWTEEKASRHKNEMFNIVKNNG